MTIGTDLWRARCVVTRTPGSEGGPGKRTDRNVGTAPRPDPTRSTGVSAGGDQLTEQPQHVQIVVQLVAQVET